MFRIFFLSLASIFSIYIIFGWKNFPEVPNFFDTMESSSELVPIAPQTSNTYKTPLEAFFSITPLSKFFCQFLFFDQKNTVLARIAKSSSGGTLQLQPRPLLWSLNPDGSGRSRTTSGWCQCSLSCCVSVNFYSLRLKLTTRRLQKLQKVSFRNKTTVTFFYIALDWSLGMCGQFVYSGHMSYRV